MGYTIKDASGATVYIEADGAGTSGDPYKQRISTGATDDAAAAGQIFPLAGEYQSTVDEVDAGDVGRVRMTARRTVITANDFLMSSIGTADVDSANKYIDGIQFKTFQALKLGSSDGSTYGTSSKIIIPIGAAGFTDMFIRFRMGNTSFDQAVTVTIKISPYGDLPTGQVAQFTIPANANYYAIGIGTSGAVGTGGDAGGSTATSTAFYSIPALKNMPYAHFTLSASTAPTVGDMTMYIDRM